MMRRIKNIMLTALMLLAANCLLVSQNVYARNFVEKLMNVPEKLLNGWNYLLDLFVMLGIRLGAIYFLVVAVMVVVYKAREPHQLPGWMGMWPKIIFGSWLLIAVLIMVFSDNELLFENQSESSAHNRFQLL